MSLKLGLHMKVAMHILHGTNIAVSYGHSRIRQCSRDALNLPKIIQDDETYC